MLTEAFVHNCQHLEANKHSFFFYKYSLLHKKEYVVVQLWYNHRKKMLSSNQKTKRNLKCRLLVKKTESEKAKDCAGFLLYYIPAKGKKRYRQKKFRDY